MNSLFSAQQRGEWISLTKFLYGYDLFFDYLTSEDFHVRPQSLMLFHQCSSTIRFLVYSDFRLGASTLSSKNDRLRTDLKHPPGKLFQNPNS